MGNGAISATQDGGLMVMLLFGCFIFAIAIFVYVFQPPRSIASGPRKTRLSYLEERKDAVYENLRDLSFEHKAGKLSDSDFEQQRGALEDEAAAILAEMTQLETTAKTVSATKKRSLG